MNNYYFNYLKQEWGEKDVEELISNILKDANIENGSFSFNLDNWNFIYFFSVYLATVLKYFGMDKNRINFCLNLVIAPGWDKMFNFEEVFKIQKNNIPKIEELIDKELKKYHS